MRTDFKQDLTFRGDELHVSVDEVNAVAVSRILLEPHRNMFPAARLLADHLVDQQSKNEETWVHLSSHSSWRAFFENPPLEGLTSSDWEQLRDSIHVMVYVVNLFYRRTREALPQTAILQLEALIATGKEELLHSEKTMGSPR